MTGRVDQRREQQRDYRLGPAPLRRRGAVLVVDGFGVSLRVDHGRLVARSGFGRQISERVFSRTDGLVRVVVLGRAGTLTLAALGWLADLGVGLICVDPNGLTLAVSGQLGVDEPKLRRAQALAAGTELGLEICRFLLTRKLTGQLEVAGALPDLEAALVAGASITTTLAELVQAASLTELRHLEARAAKAYWQAWSSVPLSFAVKDAGRIPDGWRSFGSRTSVLSGGPRLAITPGNALANYLYALAESEATLALRAVGLDPGLGLIHADQRARDSLALDLLEAVRPDVDRYLLTLLRQHTFTTRDFYENRRGTVRLLPPLTHQLAQTLPVWAERLAPLAEHVAEASLAGRPTPLTQSRRSAGRDHLRRRSRRRKPSAQRLPATCRTCGAELSNATRTHCDGCLPNVRAGQRLEFTSSGPAALASLRANGRDPAHGGDAGKRRSQTMRRHKREAAEWDAHSSEPIDGKQFAQEILPAIESIPLRLLAEATGLSLRYCVLIRRGERVPHPRHWQALRQVLEDRSGWEG